jgi:hypothetical protein
MAPGDVRQLRLEDAAVRGWQQCFGTTVGGYKVEACVSIDATEDEIEMELVVTVGGVTYRFHETLDGNQCFRVSIVGPLSLEACISKWTVEEDSVSFTLAVFVSAVIRVKLYEGQLTIPFYDKEHVRALDSASVKNPEQLMHLLALLSSIEQNAFVGGRPELGSPAGCGCGCGGDATAGASSSAPGLCPPNDSTLGSCFAGATLIPGSYTCASCCGKAGATGWVNPLTKQFYSCT